MYVLYHDCLDKSIVNYTLKCAHHVLSGNMNTLNYRCINCGTLRAFAVKDVVRCANTLCRYRVLEKVETRSVRRHYVAR